MARRYPLRRKIYNCVGTIGPDGTGEVWVGGDKVRVQMRITRRHPRGALYDRAGKVYEWPTPPRKSEDSDSSAAEFFAEV